MSTRACSWTAVHGGSRAIHSGWKVCDHGPCTEGVWCSPGKGGPLAPACWWVDREDMGCKLQGAVRARGLVCLKAARPLCTAAVPPCLLSPVLPPLSSCPRRLHMQTSHPHSLLTQAVLCTAEHCSPDVQVPKGWPRGHAIAWGSCTHPRSTLPDMWALGVC